ncbi:MAG TPA: glycerophosphodiester phosphodiesterase [Candidatus Sulfotelmatobacter sp.]
MSLRNSSKRPRPVLLGHRGTRGNKSIAENTLASFDQALADGCDGFEFDVRLTLDEEAVVCHDPKSGSVVIGRTRASALCDLPSLSEVLQRYRSSAFLDIEIKVAGLENIVFEGMRRHKPTRGFVISSFLPQVLRRLHGLDPHLPLGLICEKQSQLKLWENSPAGFLILHYGLVQKKLIDSVKDAGKKIFVWTVNNEKMMKELADWKVDGIISDHTQMLASVLGDQHGKLKGHRQTIHGVVD